MGRLSFSSLDVEALREQFPVTRTYAYFNHAAVSPLPLRVEQAMARLLSDVSHHGTAHRDAWEEAYASARMLAAKLIGADPEEIAFLKNTSEGISAVANGYPWSPGDNVVTAQVEFPANVYPWLRLEELGVQVKFVAEKGGRILCEDLFSAVDDRTRVLTLSFVQYLSGFRADLKRIGQFCSQRQILFVVDAIQGLGAFPLNVREAHIDCLAADGHKWLLGPEGAAIFFCSRAAMEKIKPVTVGWTSVESPWELTRFNLKYQPDARRYECGTLNTVGIHGLGAALELLLEVGIENIAKRIIGLTDTLCQGLKARGYSILSPRDSEHEKSGIVSFMSRKLPATIVCHRLLERKIVVSERMNLVRASPHFYNTEEEIERFLMALDEIEA